MTDHRSATRKPEDGTRRGTFKKYLKWLPLTVAAIVFATTTIACSSQTATVVVNIGTATIQIESMDSEKLAEAEPGEMVSFRRFYPSREGGSYFFVIKEMQASGETKETKRYVSAEEFRSNFVEDVLILMIDTNDSGGETLINRSER